MIPSFAGGDNFADKIVETILQVFNPVIYDYARTTKSKGDIHPMQYIC